MRVATRFKWRVEVGHQGLEPQALAAFAAKQNAVGAFVRHELHATAFGAGLSSSERVHYAHHFGCRSMLEADNVDVFIATLVDALDDPGEPVHVIGAVGDDEDVRRRVGGQMAVLRNERAQDGHQLRRTDVAYLQDLRDDFIGGAADFVGQVVRGNLPCVGVRNDFPHAPRRHGHEAMHLQDGQEGLVERFRRHGRGGEHRHLRLGARVDNEILARDLAYRFDDLAEVRVFVVRRDEWAVGAVARGGGRGNGRVDGGRGGSGRARLLGHGDRHQPGAGGQRGGKRQRQREKTGRESLLHGVLSGADARSFHLVGLGALPGRLANGL